MSSTLKGWRNDAVSKVTGTAKYAADLKVPGMLHAVPVYSDYVHAKLCHIETSRALRCDGVVRVITAADAPGTVRFGQIRKDLRMLVDDIIRYNGDVVALVVAEQRAQAIAAAQLVTIEAEPLPLLLDPESAMLHDAPKIHEEYDNNLINEHRIRRGDTKQGFAQSEWIIEQEFRTSTVEHAYLEPEAVLCIPRADGVIEIHAGMQHPFSTRRFVAAMLGVKLADVEVIGTPMGGGFGGKDDTIAVICARAALAAKLTNRPVRIKYDRSWSIRESYKRHPYRMKYRMGIDHSGKIQAVDCRIIADGGAYCSVTPWVTWRSTVQCCGAYEVPNVHTDAYGVYTNNVYTGAMRGFGSPQVNFAVEQLVEIAAEKSGFSEIEFRRRNMVRQGSVTVTGQRLSEHTVSLEQVLNSVLTEIDYENKRKRCSFGDVTQNEWYGIGLAMSYRGMSLGAEGMDFCAAIINVQFDGSILLEVGIHENGQGAETAFTKLLSDELGVPIETIRYRRSSTSTIPDSGTTVASRGTLMGGGAVVDAAAKLKAQISEYAAPLLECDASSIKFIEGNLVSPSGKPISFREAINELYRNQQFPFAFGVFRAPRVTWDEETGQGNAYFTWVYGCQAAEVSVNPKTGRIKLLNVVAVHDVGRAINSSMLLGQVYGGVAMGTGYGILEELKSVDGKITSLNFNDYRIARATDLPEIKAIVVENHDPLSKSGAKGLGEPTNELMAAVLANAVYRATGKRYYHLPIKVEPVALPVQEVIHAVAH